MSEATATATKVLDVLVQVTGAAEVRTNLDLPLFDLGILDSLGTVQLIIALSDALGIDIAPSEVERDQWATPRKIISYVEKRLPA
jgi:D-alanine--poly(phosphoribitol) ligase subunit 2